MLDIVSLCRQSQQVNATMDIGRRTLSANKSTSQQLLSCQGHQCQLLISILLGATMKVHTRARSVDGSCSLEHRCTTGCILQVLETSTDYAHLGQGAQLGAL